MPDKYGEFEYDVMLFKRYVTIANPRFKRLENGKPCECWLTIKEDFKKFTKEDIRTLATNMYGTDFFEILLELKEAAKEAVGGNPTARALAARKSLTDLAPLGMDWSKFSNMVESISQEFSSDIKKARYANHKWVTDGLLQESVNLKLYPLDKDRLNKMADNKKLTEIIDIRQFPGEESKLKKLEQENDTLHNFLGVLKIARFCVETEVVTDPETNKPVKVYTKAARYAQAALKQLSSDKKWETLYDSVREIKQQKRESIMKEVKEMNRKEDAKWAAEKTGTALEINIESSGSETETSSIQQVLDNYRNLGLKLTDVDRVDQPVVAFRVVNVGKTLAA